MKFNYILKILDKEINRYHTRIYNDIMKDIKKKGIRQKYYKTALDWFFYNDRKVPLKEKKSIEKILVLKKDRIFVIFTRKNRQLFEHIRYLAYKTGWYFYITGAELNKDIITRYIDKNKLKKEKINLNWEISKNFLINLVPIASKNNENSYLIEIDDQENLKKIYILLDIGLERAHVNIIKGYTDHLDLIFISHAHKDHSRGLFLMRTEFPNTPIISSRTTLEYYLLYNWEMGEKINENMTKIDFIMENYYFVKNDEEIIINNSFKIKLFYAGHLPGALMFYFKLHDYQFLYTGDFSFYDTFPLAGAKSHLKKLPEHIDFCLIDGIFSSENFDAPSHIFNVFKDKISKKVRFSNKILIAADYGSMALVYFFTIFKFFREQQKEFGEKVFRPQIYLSSSIKRFFSIMSYNRSDLHPYIQKQIRLKHNPFQSGIIRWLDSIKDLENSMREPNGIYILPDAALNKPLIQKAIELIGGKKHNLIYLCGPLRTPPAIEMASGNKQIKLNNKIINIKADVWNEKYPNLVLNLHSDEIQIEKLLDKIKPFHTCFFHQTPRKLIKIRSNLSKVINNIETSAIYPNSIKKRKISEKFINNS
ncbi:MAG: MBL fold metallo-hydrolase [Promethearchaeota archaeon]